MTAATAYRPAGVIMASLLALAFVGAWLTKDSGWLSLTPPPPASGVVPQPDVTVGDELALYQSAYTAWAALLLLIPAYCYVWTRRFNPTAWARWLAFWTVGYVAYIVHLVVSMFGFFGGDVAWMTTSTRVSAFWPGMLIAVWWLIDIVLARVPDQGWVTAQRVALHVLTFALFVGGSVVKGETTAIKLLGAALGLAGLVAVFSWIARRRAHG